MTGKTLVILLAILVNTNYSYRAPHTPFMFYRRNISPDRTAFSYPYEHGNHDMRFSPLYRRDVLPRREEGETGIDGGVELGAPREPRSDSSLSPSRSTWNSNIASGTNFHERTRKARQNNPITGANCVFGFCEEAENYPEKKIRELLSKSRKYDAFFKVSSSPDITMKSFGEDNLCNARDNTTFPRLALNLESKQRYVVNLDNNKQGVKMELCNDQGKACKFNEYLPEGHGSMCEQKFTIIPLLVLDDHDEFVTDVFRMPSCCVCMHKVL